jgi:hypothetical protein
MFYGPTRAGKTFTAATACEVPELSPVLLIDGDRSSVTLQGDPRFGDVKVIRPPDFLAFNDIFNWLNSTAAGEFRTIIIDELAAVHSMCMAGVMAELLDEHPGRDPDVPSMREWGIARARMLKMLKHFRDLPNTHLILTSLAWWLEDAVEKRQYILPSLPGKLSNEIPALVDVLVYIDFDRPKRTRQKGDSPPEDQRMAQFASSRRFKAGVRGDLRAERFGDVMVNPTMLAMYNLFLGR